LLALLVDDVEPVEALLYLPASGRGTGFDCFAALDLLPRVADLKAAVKEAFGLSVGDEVVAVLRFEFAVAVLSRFSVTVGAEALRASSLKKGGGGKCFGAGTPDAMAVDEGRPLPSFVCDRSRGSDGSSRLSRFSLSLSRDFSFS
jgi:hypothetical protein